ncbi:CubicO group peptidase, beta-lactamase class C family [Natronorubrum sediminis]|uniref:CubicO group peptidase, beta-lactamase class C family n=1 Tax=Natronorubrum sediminis TaxID=640943 RepID=A0A1H6FR02_9EURY|nr:serine hydrolase domain-containing protein [Natronorubrum sediminis]SEH12174.1 CubicO group peptidase, beta-lactamase class C family [Natronorubrum sediminis]
MNRRRYLTGLGAVTLGSVLAGCSASQSEDDGDAENRTDTDNDGEKHGDSSVVPEGIERIEETFYRQLEHEIHHGAQLAVYKEGELVVDLAGGVTGPEGGETERDTRHILFSTTKPYTAGCVHRLVDRSDVAYDDAVVDHWPAFADGDSGKEEITIRQVLTHQSGLPAIPSIDDDYSVWNEPDEKERRVEQAELIHPPGAAVQYHLLSYGWILGGLVRQVTGKRLDQFAKAELFAPLGMDDTSIGLGKDEDTAVATLVGFDPYDQIEDPSEEDAAYNAEVAASFNSEQVQSGVVGGANGIGTARDLARFYQCLLADGEDVFSADIVDEWTSVQVEEADEDGGYSRWGLGVSFGGAPMDSYGVTAPQTTYGHGGLGSIISWADPVHDLAFAYVTNGIRDGYEHGERASTMADTVRHELW